MKSEKAVAMGIVFALTVLMLVIFVGTASAWVPIDCVMGTVEQKTDTKLEIHIEKRGDFGGQGWNHFESTLELPFEFFDSEIVDVVWDEISVGDHVEVSGFGYGWEEQVCLANCLCIAKVKSSGDGLTDKIITDIYGDPATLGVSLGCFEWIDEPCVYDPPLLGNYIIEYDNKPDCPDCPPGCTCKAEYTNIKISKDSNFIDTFSLYPGQNRVYEGGEHRIDVTFFSGATQCCLGGHISSNFVIQIEEKKPDLIIQDISWSHSNPKQGDTVTINVKTKNQGSGNTGGFYVCYYVDGSYYNRNYVSSLSAGSTTTTSFTWTADCGSHSIKAVADCYDAVAESNEGNNARTEYINIPCKPDLVVQDISWDKSSPKQGDTVTFTVKIKNQGSGYAGASYVYYYINGSYVNYDYVPALSAGSTSTQSFTWTANKCGNVQIKAVADANNAVDESNEGNNERTETVSVTCPNHPPTAYIDSITPNPANQGETVSFSGYGTDPDGDLITAYNWRSSIDGQLSTSPSFSTSSLSVGAHTIYFKVKDSPNAWSDEILMSLDISSEIKFIGTLIEQNWFMGFLSYYFEVDEAPEGSVPVGDKIRVYVYTDGYPNQGTYDQLESGDRAEVYAEFEKWRGKEFDQWVDYKVWVADIRDNEKYYVEKMEEKPDLIIQDISWSPSNPKQGDTVTINVKTKNQGSGNAGGFYVCYYVDGSYYDRDYISSLSAGSTTTTSFSWTADCGSHAIKAVADCYNAVAESKEENNWMSKGGLNIPCKPDLIIQDISWDKGNPKQGDTITFTVKIKNQGDGNAGSSTVKYYIDDSYVASDYVSSLSAGSTSTQTFTWTANKCGDVKVKAVADANKNIEESDETNNEKEKTFNIKCPELPDLIVESITWKIKEGTENTVEVSVTIKNQGEADAKGFTVKYYVDGKEVDSDSISSLSKGCTTTETFSWDANGKSPEDHGVKVIADVCNKVKESSEDNNVKTAVIICIDIEVVGMDIVQVIKSSKLNNNLVCDKPFEVWLRVQTTPSPNELKRKGIDFSRFIFGVEAKIGDTKINENEKSQLWGKQHGFADENIVMIDIQRIRDPGKYTVDASIHGPIVYRVTGHEYPDPNLDNNKNKADVDIKDLKNFENFKIYYLPIDFTPDDFLNFLSTAEVNNLFLKETYPIPNSRLNSFYNKNILSSPPSLWPTWTKENNTLLWIELELFRTLVGADRLVGIVPDYWFNDKDASGWFKWQKSVLVKEWSQTTAAHEIGHTFGLCEEYKVKKGRRECPYSINPNAPGKGQEDPEEVKYQHGRESDAYPGKRCMMGGRKYVSNTWICHYCYMHLFKKLIGETKSTSGISSQSLTEQENIQTYQSPTEVLFISGIVYKNGSVEFYELSRMKAQIPDQIMPGNYSIECLDADGKVLSETPFDVSFYTEYGEGEVNVTGFAFAIPYQSGTKKVVVKYMGEVKDEFVLSSNSPTISVISPNGGESFSGSFTVTWTANDPDGDELSYMLLYSNNGGTDWEIIAMDINETSYAVNTSMLGGGTKCMVKVIVSDSANTAEDTSDGSFTVETKNPIASITSPLNNSEFMEWDGIEFSGFGYDFDDGILPDESLVWTSSIDGVIGYGSSFTNSSLSAGMHLITLTAKDSGNKAANDTIVIKVLSRKPTPIFNFTPSKIFTNQRVTFNASLSYDLDGNITNYEWVFGDETNETGVIVNHSYTIPGKYNVVLTVTDNDGLTNSTAKEITIGKISEVIFEDDFSELNLNNWIPFGTPSPRVLASAEGRTGVFDNNGDANCNSGVVSKDNFSFPNGFTIESDIYLDVTNVAGCWNSPVIGLTRQNKPTGEGVCPSEDYPMGVIFGTEYDGDACWATPPGKRRHAYFIIGLYTEEGTWESVSWLNADDYTDAWHNVKIAVGRDRIVKFYVDNDLIYTSEKRINETLLQEKKIFLGIRSSNSAGKSYHDYIKVYTLRKGEQKTVDIPIKSGKDDGYFMTFVSDSINDTSDILIGQVAADIFSLKFSAFMRFPNVAIPKDAKITKAYISVVPTFTNQSGPLMKITATDQSNPTIPKDYSDYSNRLRTKASVDWDASNWNEGVSVNSPDISSVIQELVDSYDYLTGAPILFFLDDADTEMRTKYQLFAAYEHTEHEPAKLHIEYITGGESESPLKMTITSDKEEYSPGDNVTITTRFEIIHATPEEPVIITNPISTTFTIDGELVFEDVSPGLERYTFIGETWLERSECHTIPEDAPEGYCDVTVSFSGGKYVKTAENLFFVKADDVPGDVTGDGRVDYKDLTGIIEHFGAIDTKYDVDRSGTVGYPDVNFILDHWTASKPYGRATTTVKGPVTVPLGSSFKVLIKTDGTVEAAHISVIFPSELNIESINVDPDVDFDFSTYQNGTDWIDVMVAEAPGLPTGYPEAPLLAEICFTATEEGTYTIDLSSVLNGEANDVEALTVEVEVEAESIDTTLPVVISVEQSNDSPEQGEDVTITAHVTDNIGVTSVTEKGGYWSATIPGQPTCTTLCISVTASDAAGNTATFWPHGKHWVDTIAPTISNMKVSPTYALPGDSINISAGVFYSSGIRWVRAFISKGGEDVGTIFMSDSDGDGVYTGTWQTMNFTESGTYNIDISATDTDGNEALAKGPEIEIA